MPISCSHPQDPRRSRSQPGFYGETEGDPRGHATVCSLVCAFHRPKTGQSDCLPAYHCSLNDLMTIQEPDEDPSGDDDSGGDVDDEDD